MQPCFEAVIYSTKRMDQDVLSALIDALKRLATAQQGLEAEVALLRRAHTDTVTALKRLRRWKLSQEAAAGLSSSASGVDSNRQQATRPGGVQPRVGTGRPEQRVQASNVPGGHAPAQPGSHTAQQLQLPAEFVCLQQVYNTAAAADQSPVTAAAAGGFLHSLNAAYGPGGVLGCQRQQQQQYHHQGTDPQALSRCCSADAFAEQAQFVGLVAAVLSAVQELTTVAGSGAMSPGGGAGCVQLQSTVPMLLRQCEHWLQDYSTAAPQQQEQQQQQAAACRWRNRVLRSVCASDACAATDTRAMAAAGSGRTQDVSSWSAGSCADAVPASTASPSGVWLPASCWGPLCTNDSAAAARSGSAWHVLLPQHAPQAATVHAVDPARTPQGSGRRVEAAQPVTLTYTQPSELIQHSRQLQKIQQLLLQLAVESQAVPRLLLLLLQGCQKLQDQMQGPHRQLGGATSTHERCCALYRFVYGLAAGPVKQRGLGASCQLALKAEAWDSEEPCRQ